MSLRGEPALESATLPDGRQAEIWIGVRADDYVAARELDTVALELRVNGEVVAALNTLLEPEQTSEALPARARSRRWALVGTPRADCGCARAAGGRAAL